MKKINLLILKNFNVFSYKKLNLEKNIFSKKKHYNFKEFGT